jgi:hypothetical protein
MTPQEVEARFQRIEAILIANAEAHAKEMSEIRAIANSNARAILANTEANRATDAKLNRLADLVVATDAKIDRLADLVERYIVATQIRQDASEIRVEGLENRVSDLENNQ